MKIVLTPASKHKNINIYPAMIMPVSIPSTIISDFFYGASIQILNPANANSSSKAGKMKM